MIQAILLDLDNTLILFNEKEFLSKYVYLLNQHFIDLVNPEAFQTFFFQAVNKMMQNNGPKTNYQVFLDEFSELSQISEDDIIIKFESFYSGPYNDLTPYCTSSTYAKDLIETVSTSKEEILLVLATNPLFPRVALINRLNWIGLDDKFDLITDCEIMHSCKPREEYYQEICKNINVDPQFCLVAGNDSINDMAAGVLGMKTYLVDEKLTKIQEKSPISSISYGLIDPKTIPRPDFCGSLKQLYNLVNLICNC